MHELRQHGAGARRELDLGMADENAAVERPGSRNEFFEESLILRINGTDQSTVSLGHQLPRIAFVGQERSDWPEDLVLMDGGTGRLDDDRRNEVALRLS